MLRFFNTLKKIKVKLLIQFGALLFLSVLLMGVMLYSLERIFTYTDIRKNSMELNITVLQMRRAEKDFLLRDVTSEPFYEKGQSKYLTKYDELYTEATARLALLAGSPVLGELGYRDSVQTALSYLQNYSKSFHEIADLYRTKGFKDWGYEGELRKTIHDIEEGQQAYDKTLMLSLRRHEKDFLLRKDLNYVTKFDHTLQAFKESLVAVGAAGEMLASVDSYGQDFHRIVDTEKQLGFSDEEGLKGRLRSIIHQIEPLIEHLGKNVAIHVDNIKSKTLWLLIGLFISQLIAGLWLSVSFANATTVSIQTIKDRITKLSEGVFPSKIVVQTQDEIGETTHSLNNLIERIRTAADFAGKIGGGELNITYDDNFNNDVLAQSLQTMHEKLREAAEEHERRNWSTTGLANFSEILRTADQDLTTLSNRMVSSLVKYLNANQGQLYMIQESNHGQEHLELMATYAWNKQKYVNRTIQKGEGLTGQAWQEMGTLYLTEIPANYITITSGLGEASPANILIVPLKLNEQAFGILEIAAFRKLEPYQIEFVEKLAEVIASTLSSVKVNLRTRLLLEESQHQAEELRAQEEEMRQNQEEMQSTQEELSRQRKEMEEEIKRLETEMKQYKQALKHTNTDK